MGNEYGSQSPRTVLNILVRERSETTRVFKAQVRRAEPVVPPKATTSACEATLS